MFFELFEDDIKVALQCAAVPVDSSVSAEMQELALGSDLEAGQDAFRKFFDRHFQTKFLHKLAELWLLV